MLSLTDIVKVYGEGDYAVRALRGVNISFRDSEFVCILGPSGCGKTTLLNIIGGLDRYTGGNLAINGRSTAEYKPRDWDAYRNHSVGFVFQSYNLIAHQTVLSNVELALTLSGVGRAERRKRALAALEDVGLLDQAHKKPNQLSGGQMQRVAIARALVNDPEILLADEPTGALDSATSVQVMELLKSISKNRLVIMVTHNPTLAEKYATRTVKLLDGEITSDSDPYRPAGIQPVSLQKGHKTSMSLFTAFSLSMNNLMTKKARTMLTAFAGSIGIIGIALIISLSNGIQNYIDKVQEDTLSSYPITIEAEAADLSALIGAFADTHPAADDESGHGEDAVYSNEMLLELLNSLNSADTQTNDLAAFKAYLESQDCPLMQHAGAVSYSYDLNFNIYTQDPEDNIVKTDVVELMQSLMSGMYGGDYSSYFSSMGSYYSNFEVWEELLAGEDGELVSETLRGQYDLLYGHWPESSNEVVLFLNADNEISDLVLYALGLSSENEMLDALKSAMAGDEVGTDVQSWSYEEICAKKFKLIMSSEYYRYDSVSGGYTDMSTSAAGLDYLFNSSDIGTTITISAIVRPAEDAAASMVSGSIGYTSALSQHVIEATNQTEIVKAQLADQTTDVILNLPFATPDDPEPTRQEKLDAALEYIAGLENSEKAEFYVSVMAQASADYVSDTADRQLDGMTRDDVKQLVLEGYAAEMGVDADTVSDYIDEMDDDTLFGYVRDAVEEEISSRYAQSVRSQLSRYSAVQLALMLDKAKFTDEQIDYMYENLLPPTKSDSTYAENLKLLGWVDPASPDKIYLYALTFEDKDAIADDIAAYNASVDEEQAITYTDYVALLMSSITTIINAISYVLIAFVTISLVVSSIMIGIITYISVLERTKEIGILRSIGASRRDVARVFTAETLIEGFVAGATGIGVSLLLLIPINIIVRSLTGIQSLSASLPVAAGAALVVISMLLTLLAGVIPSRFASRRDPVEALRSE